MTINITMTYSIGGLIQATDYNSFLTGLNQINTIWSTGTGDAGYGQTALTSLSIGATVASATQWATLINTVNSIARHQTNNGTNLTSTTAGGTVTYLSGLSGNISTYYTNRGTFATQGSTVTGTNLVSYANAAAAAAYNNTVFTRTITFSSGDAARYFFNAGGQLNLVLSTTIKTASARSTATSTLIGTNIGGFSAFRRASGGGRTGTGGTVTTNSTVIGYRQLTTVLQTLVLINNATAPYTTDVANLRVKSNGVQGANGDLGSIITFTLGLSAPAHSTFNGALGVGVNHRIDVVPPETTNISNSWGTITVA